MKKMTKVFSFILALSVIGSLMVSAEGINYKTYNNFVYTDHDTPDGGVTVTNYTGTKKTVTIPAKIDDKDVLMVTPFKNAKGVTTLKIPASVQYVRVSQAPNLKKITIAKDNKYLKAKNGLVFNKKGNWIRSCAGALKTVKIPDTVTKIHHQAFVGARVKTVTIGKNVKTIDTYAFYKCKKLSKVIIKNTKKAPKIRKEAFEDTRDGIKFVVNNRTVAKQLRRRLDDSDADDAKIYVGKTLVYRDVD